MNKDTEAKYKKLIRELPTSSCINEDDVNKWLYRTSFIDPDRIEWHIKRASGIGGSEAGTLVSWMYGDVNSRENANRLAKKKLFIIPPDRQNDDTGRGIYLESHIQKVYEENLTRDGRDWKRRNDLKEKIENNPAGILRASLDAVYEIDGEIVIADFKAPSEESLKNFRRYEKYDEYNAQLNHYHIVAANAGVKVDRLELALYDYRQVASVGTENVDVEISPALQSRIVNAATMFWNEFILKGLIPDKEEADIVTCDIPSEIEEIARRTVASKVASDRAEKQYEAGREEINNWVATNGVLGNQKMYLGKMSDSPDAEGFLEIKASQSFDEDKAVSRLKDLGVSEDEIENTMRLPDAYDSKKVLKVAPEMSNIINKLIGIAQSGEQINEDTLKEMMVFKKALTIKSKGGYDHEKIQKKLAELGDEGYGMSEVISSGLPRKKNTGLDEFKEKCGAEVDAVIKDVIDFDNELKNTL